MERFGLAGRKTEFLSVCIMGTDVRKEVGQIVGVVTLSGCVPLIIRKLWSAAAFHQLNCEEEKTQSFLEQRHGTKYTSWDEGASVWRNVRDKEKGPLASERVSERSRLGAVRSNSKNVLFFQLMGITVTNIKKKKKKGLLLLNTTQD